MRIQIRNTHEKMHALDLKDPACQSTTCSFIVAALAARDALPRMEASLAEKEAEIAEKRKAIEAQIETLHPALTVRVEERRTWIETLSLAKKETADQIIKINKELSRTRDDMSINTRTLNGTQKRISECRNILVRLKDLSACVPEIRIADARKQDLDRQYKEVLEQGIKLRSIWKEKEAVLSSRIEGERKSLSEIERQIDKDSEEQLRIINMEIDNIEKIRIPNIEIEIAKSRD